MKTRRSVRKFKNELISENDLIEIIEAGMYAPSAGNEQAWQFVIIKDAVLKKYLELNKNVPQSAPIGILVCTDKNLEKYKPMSTAYMDCSAAVQNILLYAHSKGFGALWTAVFDGVKDKISQLLNLPHNIEPFAFIPVGYPEAEDQIIPQRFDKAKIHFNEW